MIDWWKRELLKLKDDQIAAWREVRGSFGEIKKKYNENAIKYQGMRDVGRKMRVVGKKITCYVTIPIFIIILIFWILKYLIK